jgi:uncharacterized membrane protein HdeD (DUF308 family)
MDTSATTMEGVSIPWWLTLLEGIAAVIIGLFLITAPGITLLFLVQVTGFFGSSVVSCESLASLWTALCGVGSFLEE